MKFGSIKITVELSKGDYELITRGRAYLEQDYKAKSGKTVLLSDESFLHYAINKAIDDLEKEPLFNEN